MSIALMTRYIVNVNRPITRYIVKVNRPVYINRYIVKVNHPIIIIIIILKKVDRQCKAEREWYTPYQSEDPSPTIPIYRQKEEKGKKSRRL